MVVFLVLAHVNFLSFLTHRIQQISKLMKAICTLLLSRGNQMFHVSFMSARKANKQEDVQQHQRLSFSFHSSAFSIRSVKTKPKASQKKSFSNAQRWNENENAMWERAILANSQFCRPWTQIAMEIRTKIFSTLGKGFWLAFRFQR